MVDLRISNLAVSKTHQAMNAQFSIRDLAQEFEITTRTLRFYEEKGLLKPVRSGQTRVYDNADRTRLRLILRGKRLGLTLDESAEVILMYDPQAGNKKQMTLLIEKIQNKRSQLLMQQKDLELMLKDLDNAEKRCQDALENTP